ncbi:MAG: helix-turn-helix domain-containing protein [Clostridiales bacterium]|nr:helix-turn-helix domain-containing protein [Clostridiales bacterium]
MAYQKSKTTENALYEDLHRPQLHDAIASCLHFLEDGNLCREIPPHYHDFVEIIYGIRGRFSASMADQDIEVNEGDMLLINVNEVHAFHHFEPCEYYCLQFDPTVFFFSSAYSTGAKYLLPFLMSTTRDLGKNNTFSLLARKEELENTHIPDYIRDYHKEFTEQAPGYELAIRADICRIFLWYLRRMEKNGISVYSSPGIRQEDILRLNEVLDYIHENYMQPVLAEKMAKMCNMSYSYFSRFFRHAVGQTFSDYLLYVRLTEAEKLLITSSKSISQIALDTGFSTSSYFITQFKKHRHITPKQLKQKIAAADEQNK